MGKKRLKFSKEQANKLRVECSIKLFFAGLVGLGAAAHADVPIGLLGGQTSQNASAYAAFLSNLNGDISPLSPLPDNAAISTVALNSSGKGLAGGQSNGNAFAVSISPDGTLTPITLSVSAGYISGVAINESGFGLIGGADSNMGLGYVAQVLADGTVIPCSVYPPSNTINAVSLNNSNVGLVGGEGGASVFAAYVGADGTVTQILNTPGVGSNINSVALNELGNGIIGGFDAGFNGAYAAFVTPGAATPVILSPVPSGNASIASVAINTAGTGLIGGTDTSLNAYAGYAASDGSVTTLFDSPFGGYIFSVALNDSGTGLIGGQNGSDMYAALVQPDGTLAPVFLASTLGSINSVALNEAGLGLIGGQTGSSNIGYAALVAPNGTLTPLNIGNLNEILSVALNSSAPQIVALNSSAPQILDQATPQSIGPYGSAIYMQLAANAALENRFIQRNKIWHKKQRKDTADAHIANWETQLVYNEYNPLHSEMDLALMSPKSASTPLGTLLLSKKNSLWVEPFGDFIRVKKKGSIPTYTNEVGGVLLGYDRQGTSYLLGAALGYAYNFVDLAKSQGQAKVQEEMASLYGAYYGEHIWFSTALWAGVYQFKNRRNTLSSIKSTGKSHGWIVQPHFELASPWAMGQKELCFIEPFVQLDWVNNWQHHFTESGSSGLNVKMPHVYNSLLQSEAGLRFYERFLLGWGDFCLEEKFSYINQTPFDVKSVDTSFISSASSFPIRVASSKVQNMGALELLACFVPRKASYPYGGFAFQASLGSSFQSYFVSVFTGKDF